MLYIVKRSPDVVQLSNFDISETQVLNVDFSIFSSCHQHYIDIDKITRSMCYYLHIRRTELLQEMQNRNYRYQSENQMITLKSIDR
jgi:hypothetical protein